jgi:FkbM family methyltransferase
MFSSLWKLLRFFPPNLLTFIKHKTSAQLRYAIRQKMGADYRTIPEKIVSVPDGRRFHIGPDPIYWGIYYEVGYEPEVSGILEKLVRSGDTIFDIGANFGWYSTMFAHHLGGSTQVYAFEPVPSTFERLNEHIKLNQLERWVIPNRIALGDQQGTTQMYVVRGRSHALASLSTQGEENYEAFNTPMQTIDSFVKEQQISNIHFIKIDVEGNELMVLKGGVNTLKSDHAPILMVEINNDTFSAFGYTALEVWNCLKDYGYDCFYGMLDDSTIAPIYDYKDFMDIANVIMLRSKDEEINSDVSWVASFKAVPGMVICGKSAVIETRIANSEIKVNKHIFKDRETSYPS